MVKMETWENTQPRTPSVAILLNQLCLRSECEEEVVELDTLNTTLNWAPFPAVTQCLRLSPIIGQHVADISTHKRAPPSRISHTRTEISGKI